jgi:transcriptional regulator with XRE-family HTH domain
MGSKQNRKYKVPIKSTERQTLGQRIKWLRAQQKPPMTQLQLADRAHVNIRNVLNFERDRSTSKQFETLYRIAVALNCYLFINLRMKAPRYPENRTFPPQAVFPPGLPELPPPPEWKGKASVEARVLAAKVLRYPWRTDHQRQWRARHKATSGKTGKKKPEPETADTPHKPPEQP